MEYILNEKPAKISSKSFIFLVIILALLAIGSIVMFINIVTYGEAHSVEAKIKQEFYKDESIMSEYDKIITYKIERVNAWQPDEELPKDVRSGCYTIHILAIREEDKIAIEQDYLCVAFYSTKINYVYRDVQLLDCDFVKIKG